MNNQEKPAICVTVTCQRLLDLAQSSCRMTGYADPNGKRLISVLQSQDGIPVMLILDKNCLFKPPSHKLCRKCRQHKMFFDLFEATEGSEPLVREKAKVKNTNSFRR